MNPKSKKILQTADSLGQSLQNISFGVEIVLLQNRELRARNGHLKARVKSLCSLLDGVLHAFEQHWFDDESEFTREQMTSYVDAATFLERLGRKDNVVPYVLRHLRKQHSN